MNSDRIQTIRLAALAALLAAGLFGCGGGGPDIPRAAVQGTVTLDGKPLEGGVIRFVPDPAKGTHGPKTTVPVMEGRFEVPDRLGPVVGSHRVEIVSTDDGGYAFDDETAIERLRAERRRRIEVVTIPPVYNRRSRLTAEVAPNRPNEFEFALTSQPRPMR